MTVRAKFTCHAVSTFAGGSKKIEMSAVYSATGENKDFVDATPQGTFSMLVAGGKPAGDAFTPGEDYYLDFTHAPKPTAA